MPADVKQLLESKKTQGSSAPQAEWDAMFGGDSDKQRIKDIDIELLDEYDGNPFNPYDEEDLLEMAESIQNNGLFHPILIRPVGNRYQILSGRNRVRASRIAELKMVSSIIMDVDDDMAALIVAETNLRQRDKVLHSERARAYKMQMDAMKRQGRRTDLVENSHKVDIASQIAEKSQDKRRNVFYYIQLLSLIEPFFKMVDNEKISFHAGVALSNIQMEVQEQIYIIYLQNTVKLTVEVAGAIKQAHDDGRLDEDLLKRILIPQKEKPKTVSVVKVSYSRIQSFFTKNEERKVIEETIIEALRFYREHHK